MKTMGHQATDEMLHKMIKVRMVKIVEMVKFADDITTCPQ